MTAKDLKTWIESMTQDIDFFYNGVYGSICPFAADDIALCYGDYAVNVKSVDDAMTVPLIDGKSLSEIAEVLEY